MHIIMFGDVIKKFQGLLLANKTYVISNAKVQDVNLNFSQVRPKFQIVEQTEENIKQNIAYNFVPFKEVIITIEMKKSTGIISH